MLPLPVRRVVFLGGARYCPVCESRVRRFVGGGHHGGDRPDAKCPVCGSEERHRLLWLFIRTETDVLDSAGKRILDVAPAACLRRRLQRVPGVDYIAVDAAADSECVRANITELPFRDEWFDLVLCSHVLEHVANDMAAMRELARVLKKQGLAIIQVPVTAVETHEDASIREADDRDRVFGWPDHVRRYGPDIRGRLEMAGFDVHRYAPVHLLGYRERCRFAIPEDEDLFLCEKGVPTRHLTGVCSRHLRSVTVLAEQERVPSLRRG